MSRPPSVSVSPKRSSFCTSRSASPQIQRWIGLSMRSNIVALAWSRADCMPCILASLELSYTLPPMRSFTARLTVEILVAALGGALLISAFIANQPWLDRHFLPAFFVSRSRYVLVESFARVATAAVGAMLALAARAPVARFVTRSPARALQVTVAIVLAFGASEFMLRRIHPRAAPP